MIDASVVLSHPSTPLTIGDGPSELIAVGVTGTEWRRYTVEGRYQHGRALIGAVMGTPTLTVVVRLTGSTWAAVQTRLNTLKAITSQTAYTATVTIANQVDTYQCEPADVDLPTTLNRWAVAANVQDVTLTIPIQP